MWLEGFSKCRCWACVSGSAGGLSGGSWGPRTRPPAPAAACLPALRGSLWVRISASPTAGRPAAAGKRGRSLPRVRALPALPELPAGAYPSQPPPDSLPRRQLPRPRPAGRCCGCCAWASGPRRPRAGHQASHRWRAQGQLPDPRDRAGAGKVRAAADPPEARPHAIWPRTTTLGPCHRTLGPHHETLLTWPCARCTSRAPPAGRTLRRRDMRAEWISDEGSEDDASGDDEWRA